MKSLLLLILFVYLLFLNTSSISSQKIIARSQVKKIADILVDLNGKTIDGIYGNNINGLSFQQDLVISFKGFQYIVYYDDQNRLCLCRRNLKQEKIETIRFSDYKYRGGSDAHCTPSIGFCAQDGTLHLAFDHHNDELHYKKSIPDLLKFPEKFEWKENNFSSVRNYLELNAEPITELCYPRFIPRPNGGLQFIYRKGGSGNGDRVLLDYDPNKSVWVNRHLIDSGEGHFEDEFGISTTRCSYPNGYTYDEKGTLHCTFVWRESSEGSNHDLMYMKSPDQGNTWLNNKGDTIGCNNGLLKVNVESKGIKVVDISRKESLMNSQAQDIDSEGRIHVVMWHKNPNVPYKAGKRWLPLQSSYFHYYRDNKSAWHRYSIPSPVGNRPVLCFDKQDDAYLVYLINAIPAAFKNDIYFDKGLMIIAKATKKNGWKDWKIIHKESDFFLNEMKVDVNRFKEQSVLSVFVQDTPAKAGDASRIRMFDYIIYSK